MEMFTLLFDELLSFGTLVEHLLTSLDLLDVSLPISEISDSIPEGLLIGSDLLNCFCFNEFLDSFKIVAPKAFTCEDEVVELLPGPISESSGLELCNFLSLFLSESPLVDFLLLLFFFFLLLGMATEFFNEFLLGEVVFFFLEKGL